MKIGSKTKVTREVTRQERNRRNNMKRITVSALVAFVLFIALTIIQSSILNQETKLTVYQVQKDIHSGTKITDENFSEYFGKKDVQVSLIPDGYITDSSLIIGKFINRDYKTRDIITVDGLSDSGAMYNSNIKHPVKLSFQVGSLSDSVSGTIREGDYINIYGMKGGKNKLGEDVIVTNQIYTFKHIYIEKAYNSSGDVIDSSDREAEALIFTIIIEEDDVELFNEMIVNCKLKLVKIMYDTNQDYKAFIVGDDDDAVVESNESNESNEINGSNGSNESNESNETVFEINNENIETNTEEITNEATNELSELDYIKNAIKNRMEEEEASSENTNETSESESKETNVISETTIN